MINTQYLLQNYKNRNPKLDNSHNFQYLHLAFHKLMDKHNFLQSKKLNYDKININEVLNYCKLYILALKHGKIDKSPYYSKMLLLLYTDKCH